jgi:hypothetical protein
LKKNSDCRLGTKSKASTRRSNAFKRRISADAAGDDYLGVAEHNAIKNVVNIEIDPKSQ